MNKILLKNFEDLLNKFKFKNELKNKCIMVSGATGLLGSLIIKFLAYLNSRFQLNIKIIGLARNKNKVNKMDFPNGLEWIFEDLKEPINCDCNVNYIIHTACPTNSKYLVSNPVEVINDTVIGTNELLKFAKKVNCESFIYLSSIEVYGEIRDEETISEENFGSVNPLNIRSCYSESKRLLECLCISYYKEYGVPTKILRLTQTMGAGINLDDNRVFMQFVKSAINNKDIVLHTSGNSAKSYLYTTDAINSIFYVIFKGIAGEVYNVANPDTYISIKELANFIVNNFNTNIKVIIDKQDNMGYAPETKVNMSIKKLEKLGWSPYYNLYDMFNCLIDYIKAC